MNKTKKKALLSLLIVASMTSGCGVTGKATSMELPYVEIPWHWFQKDKEVKIEEKVKPVFELKLVDKKEKPLIEQLNSKVQELSKILMDSSMYTKGLRDRSSFEKNIGGILGGNTQNVAGKAFFSVLEDIYSDDYTAVDSISLASVGRKNSEDGEFITADIEINSTNDSMEYDIHTVHLTFNTDLVIQTAEVEDEISKNGNTTRSLTTEAFIEEDTHSEFLNVFDDYSESFRNELLYTKLMNKEEDSEKQLEVFLNEVTKDDNSKEDIKELFMLTKGNLNNGVFSEVVFTDKNASPKTNYLLSVPTTKDITTFEFQFDRSENTIDSIKKQ